MIHYSVIILLFSPCIFNAQTLFPSHYRFAIVKSTYKYMYNWLSQYKIEKDKVSQASSATLFNYLPISVVVRAPHAQGCKPHEEQSHH